MRLPRALTLKKVSRALQGLVGAIFLRRNELFRRGTGRAVAASEQYIFRIIYVGWQASVQRVWGQRRAEYTELL